MPYSDLCLNCFKVKGQYEICPYCGYAEGTPPEQAYWLNPGEVLAGRYIIGTVLGSGGFGVTYKAWDTTLSAIVAIKEFYPGGLISRIPGQRGVVVFSGDKADSYRQQLLRFLDEAKNMAKFNNDPHIVGVYDYFEENNTAYIVMEYLDGQTLKAYMGQMGGKLPESEAMRYIKPILEAIASIHSNKIIHRDISPDNIYILKDGRVKVLDFGAARFAENPEGLTSSVVVKQGYAPPEQYRSKMKQGSWTDIYAAGATLYKMLTGITPPESVDRMEKDTMKPPSALISLSNPVLDTVILKAMALAPEIRFKRADDFIDAIEGRREVELPEVEQKRLKKRRTVSVALSAVAVIALIIIIVVFGPSGGGSEPYASINAGAETITVLVRPEEQAMFETLISRYIEQFPNQTVNLTVSAGAQPTLLRHEGMPGTAAPDAAPLGELLDALRMDDYVFGRDYDRMFPYGDMVPLVFYAPACFVNTTLAPSDPVPIQELTGDALDPDAMAVYSVTARPSGDPVGRFMADEAGYLLSTTKRLREVQENLPGFYAVLMPDGIDRLDAPLFDGAWYVSAVASDNERLAAQKFLAYLLSDYAQNVMCLQNRAGIPVNRNVFEQYLEINTDLEYIQELVE